jgi:hypothetical protein
MFASIPGEMFTVRKCWYQDRSDGTDGTERFWAVDAQE